MKRCIRGLSDTVLSAANNVPDGVFLVRVDKARTEAVLPATRVVLEPQEYAGRSICGRVFCTANALSKLGWFLRDFLYDPELLGREEVDEKALSGLRGIVKVSHTTLNGSLLNFDGFAPASQWEALSRSTERTGEIEP